MTIALLLLALALMLAGGFAVATGAPIIVIERGWALVIAGTVALTGGAILLGLCAVLARLGRLAALAEAERGRGRGDAPPAPTGPPSAAPVAVPADAPVGAPAPLPMPAESSAPAEPSTPAEPEDPSESAPAPVEEAALHPALTSEEPLPAVEEAPADGPAESHLVGTYEVGGSSYHLYSDGSIVARLADGEHRFPSLAALKRYAGEAATNPELGADPSER